MMRLRILTLLLCVYLVFVLGCSSKPTGSNTSGDSSNPTDTAGEDSSNAKPKAVKLEPMAVPAGTSLTVRLGQAVGSKISQPGQTFSATLANSVEVAGKVAIPAGA